MQNIKHVGSVYWAVFPQEPRQFAFEFYAYVFTVESFRFEGENEYEYEKLVRLFLLEKV